MGEVRDQELRVMGRRVAANLDRLLAAEDRREVEAGLRSGSDLLRAEARRRRYQENGILLWNGGR